jgi:hypothetical protein
VVERLIARGYHAMTRTIGGYTSHQPAERLRWLCRLQLEDQRQRASVSANFPPPPWRPNTWAIRQSRTARRVTCNRRRTANTHHPDLGAAVHIGELAQTGIRTASTGPRSNVFRLKLCLWATSRLQVARTTGASRGQDPFDDVYTGDDDRRSRAPRSTGRNCGPGNAAILGEIAQVSSAPDRAAAKSTFHARLRLLDPTPSALRRLTPNASGVAPARQRRIDCRSQRELRPDSSPTSLERQRGFSRTCARAALSALSRAGNSTTVPGRSSSTRRSTIANPWLFPETLTAQVGGDFSRVAS